LNNNVIVNTSDLLSGENSINITCMLSGAASHRYSLFTLTTANAETLFYNAFGLSLSSCPDTAITALSDYCDEWYRTEYAYPFSAVVCQNLPAGNYSCLASSTDNQTKNGYTIFTTPGWTTPVADVNALALEHLGANFVYNGITVSNGMEIIGNYSFIYIPAQTHLRDCGVYYSSTSYCSLWSGFTLNDRTVYVSNPDNEWFAATGYGVINFNATYAMTTVTVSVTPIQQYIANQSTLNNTGIFTRMHCYAQNGTYFINVRNTLEVPYALTTTGTDGYTYSATGRVFDYSLPIYDDTTVTLTSNGKKVCYYGPNDQLFLPIDLSVLDTAFSDIFIKMMFVFAVVISAMIPYSLIITVILNDLFGLMDASHMAMVMIFAGIAALMNASFQSSRGIKNIVMMLAVVCGFMLALGSSMTENGLPSASSLTDLFTSFKSLAEAQTFTDMVAGLFTFAIQLFITIVLLPIVFVDYIADLVNFMNPNLGAAFAPFKIIAIGAVIYLYIKAYEVLGNKFKDV
jgi:hypothetical protein